MHILTTVDTIITLAIPSCVIIAFNCAIAVKVALFFTHQQKFLGHKNNMEMAATLEHVHRHICNKSITYADVNGSMQLQYSSRRTETGADCNNEATSSTTNTDSERSDEMESIGYQPVRVSNVSRNINSVQMRITRSLLMVSTVFVALNLPSHVVRLYALSTEFSGSKPTLKLLLWQQICQILSYSNFAINLVLYCACSQHFCKAFKRLVRTSCRKRY